MKKYITSSVLVKRRRYMKMITIEEGSTEMLPWIRADIEPAIGGGWPFEWWFEISYYDPTHEIDGRKMPCWVHYYQKDGGAITLWRAMRKAREAVLEVLDELAPSANVGEIIN